MRNYDYVPDRPSRDHPDVAGETQRWCSVCERIAEDCTCSDSVRSSANDRDSIRDGQANQRDNMDADVTAVRGVIPASMLPRDTNFSATPSQPATWKCASSEDHEYDICTGPPGDSRLGKLICNFCGELAPSQPEPSRNWPNGNKFNICYGCGNTFRGPGWKIKPLCAVCDPESSVAGNVGTARGIPTDAEEGLSTWYDEVERNQRENERQEEERAMFQQVQLQEETDDR